MKTHKCGSSTVQNIILRFGYINNLKFVLPLESNYLGHPQKFDKTMLSSELKTENDKYNILTHHSRYNYTSMKEVLYNDTAFVTILRNPISLFESLYSYYRLYIFYGLNIHDMLKVFPSDHVKHKTRYVGKIGVNQMSFDLGLDSDQFNDTTEFLKFLENINNKFDLVMISEYMEASLVLLCDLMNWSLNYVQFLPLNIRTQEMRTSLSFVEQEAILNLNKVDTQLYQFFLSKLKTRIEDYGVERMIYKVKQLVNLNNNLYTRCVEKKTNNGFANTTGYQLKNPNDWLCNYSSMNELEFTEEIRNWQKQEISVVKRLTYFMSKPA